MSDSSQLICICNAVRESDIDEAIEEGVRTFADLQAALHVSCTCGGCRPEAEAYFAARIVSLSKSDNQ
ncbi:MAG: (2Fe-2S)-binding protein [Pseudomonadota bacterium]